MATVLEYLRELVALTGPSGSEEEVVRAIARLARPLADSVELDALGNLIVVRAAARPEARRLALAAHMDEVGFRVRAVEPDGYLRFEKLGGFDNRILPAQRVWVRGSRGRLLGVIGTKSAHLLADADRMTIVPHTALYLDIGARSAEEVRGMGVRVGDPVGFVGELVELGLGSGRYTAHAIDDRAGCAMLLALLEAFRDESPPVTLVLLFTVQEEVGLRGAAAVARGERFDVALAVDMTALDDTPDTGTFHMRLGEGPALKIQDASQLAHPAIQRGLELAACSAGVALQREILLGIGTDAGALQYGDRGVPTGALSIGNRYTHSAVEVIDSRDMESGVRVLRHFVLALHDLDLRFTSLDELTAG